MTSDDRSEADLQRVKAAFAEALERDDDARESFLAALATRDPSVAREVRSLLAAHAIADSRSAGHKVAGGGTSASGRDAPLPERVGRYRVRALLGEGGMGRVLLAHDPDLDRSVALKLMSPGQPRNRARVLREARAAARLSHQHIATIHDVGTADGLDYIAMEYVEGTTLREHLGGRGLPWDELFALAIPLADALATAHAAGVVHRDVKASNVQLDRDHQPKLVDFGLAKLGAAFESEGASDDGGQTLTREGSVMGTPASMSPEQALGRAVDERSDVFSYGSLLFELATGHAAFSGDTAMATLDAVIHTDVPDPTDLRDDLPPGFLAILRRALRKDPAERYQRMDELLADLRGLDGKRGDGAGVRAPRRTPTRGALAAVVLLLAVLATAPWWRGASGGAATPVAEGTLGVMFFDNLDDSADDGQLGAMLARLLSADLSAASALELVSQQRLFDVARQLGREDGRIDRGVATAVAHEAGVAIMVLGQVGHAEGRLMASVELVDVGSGRSLGAPDSRGTGPEDVFAVAADLGRQVRTLLAARDLSPDERRALDRQLTGSVDAYRCFVRGQQSLQRNDVDDAVAAFREATALDPAFALAQFQLAIALVWTGADAAQAFERAFAFRENLPLDIQRLLDTCRPYFSGDQTREALPLLEQLIQEDPWQREAHYFLGEIYTHSATRNDGARAGRMYDRLLTLEPRLSLVYEHALSVDLRAGRFDVASARLADWTTLDPAEHARLQALIAVWEGRFDDATRLQPDDPVAWILADELDAAPVAAIAEASVPELVAGLDGIQGLYRAVAFDLRADVLVLVGRLDDAEALYRRAFAVPGESSLDGFLMSARNSARHHLAFLLALRGEIDGAQQLVDTVLELQPDCFRALFVAALFAARRGDQQTVTEHVAFLADLAGRGWSPTAGLYRDAATAEFALLQGRPEEARAGYRALVTSGRLMEDWYAFEDSAGPLFRDGLARACAALGDREGEIEALSGLLDAGFERLRHPVPFVQALLRRGELRVAAGREAEGRADLQRGVRAWGGCADELVALARARELLAR